MATYRARKSMGRLEELVKSIPLRSGLEWVARIKVDGREIQLGRFDFESDAAIAYNYHAYHYFGEGARLNKITEFYHD